MRDLIWKSFSGRDREGDLRSGIHLVAKDSRVLATIDYPQVEESTYQVFVGNTQRDYLEIEPAKLYAETEAEGLLLDEEHHGEWRKEYRKQKESA